MADASTGQKRSAQTHSVKAQSAQAAPTGATMSTLLLDIIEELAALVDQAKPVFMSSDIRVDKGAVTGLLEELRQGLPTAVAHADQTLREAELALMAAQDKAEDILAQARARAVELVEREQVVEDAHQRAEQIIDKAQAEADRLTANADEYCDQRLAVFGEDLDALQAQVAAGRARLAERLGPDATRPRWDSPKDPQWPGDQG